MRSNVQKLYLIYTIKITEGFDDVVEVHQDEMRGK